MPRAKAKTGMQARKPWRLLSSNRVGVIFEKIFKIDIKFRSFQKITKNL
jgi:hypothetical protein